MSAHDTEQISNSDQDTKEARHREEDRPTSPEEKPEPDEKAKQSAADMMTAYEERPTLVLPGTGGAVSGTAVNDWLNDDGNPKAVDDKDAPAAKAQVAWAEEDKDTEDPEDTDKESLEDMTARDKKFNAAVIKDAKDRAAADS